MNNGHYRIAISLTSAYEPIQDKDAWQLARRLEIFLPPESEITEIHTSPSTHFIDAVVIIPGVSPANALQNLQTAIEHLTINLRREHGDDPVMGPWPRLRSVTITHADDRT